jgi:aspartate carbamoyltransferase catalytic subunit
MARTSIHSGIARPLHNPREARQIAGLRVAIVGDILFSRVARSNIFGLLKLGRASRWSARATVPRELRNSESKFLTRSMRNYPSRCGESLRIQHERQRREYFPESANTFASSVSPKNAPNC